MVSQDLLSKEMAQATFNQSKPRISVRGIKKRFGAVEALRGVDLDIYPGECLGLVGDNAAGKSTFTKMLSGAYVPDEGEIKIDGRKVRFEKPNDAREHRIEMVYQDFATRLTFRAIFFWGGNCANRPNFLAS